MNDIVNNNLKPVMRNYRGVELSLCIDSLSKEIYQTRGTIFYNMINNWPKIVGEQFAKFCYPKKLSVPRYEQKNNKNSVLIIETINSSLATELSYMEQVIIERLATYFGYRAVDKIKITVNPKNIDDSQYYKDAPAVNKNVLKLTEVIDDDKLKELLVSLGNSIFACDEDITIKEQKTLNNEHIPANPALEDIFSYNIY